MKEIEKYILQKRILQWLGDMFNYGILSDKVDETTDIKRCHPISRLEPMSSGA